MPRPHVRPIARASLALVVGSALAIAPLADASAAQSLGMRLRTIMTLTPDEPAAEASAEEAPAEEVPAAEAPAVEAPAEAPVEGPAPPSDPEPSKGLGLMIPGAVITGVVGLPMTFFGAAIIISAKEANDGSVGGGLVDALGTVFGGAFLVIGIIGLGVGVPLLGVGAAKFSRWRDWQDRQRVSFAPSVGRSAFGTVTPGLVLRF